MCPLAAVARQPVLGVESCILHVREAPHAFHSIALLSWPGLQTRQASVAAIASAEGLQTD